MLHLFQDLDANSVEATSWLSYRMAHTGSKNPIKCFQWWGWTGHIFSGEIPLRLDMENIKHRSQYYNGE
jgi:hypothetical protein